MDKIRIAVAGAGYIGQAHMDVTRASPSCSLSAVVDPSPAAVALAAQAGVPLYASLEELIAKDRPDGVVLATPNQLHVPHALTCIAAGLPILLEKPIAPTVAEAESLLRVVDERGAKLLIGHHRAHSPIMAKAREVVASGQLGRLVTVVGSATFYKPEQYYADAPWRKEPGAGPILLNMIHEVHNLRMLCGDIVAVQAFASTATRDFAVGHRRQPAQLGADLAGEQGLSELRRRGLLRHQRHQRQPLGADHAAQDVSAAGRPLVVETVRSGHRGHGARRPAQAPDRTLRRRGARRGPATG
jgi:predicted dehydrogenase